MEMRKNLKYFTIHTICSFCGSKNFYRAKKGTKMKEQSCWMCHKTGTLKRELEG